MLCRNKFSFKLDRLFNKSILNTETSNFFADMNALNNNPMKTEFL